MRAEALQRAKAAFKLEADALLAAGEAMDFDSFGRAVDALKTAERIAASGCGHSGIACRHFVHLMCCVGRPARFLSPAEAVHGALGYVHKGDVMLLASRGGKTVELIPILDICRQKEAVVITVTEKLGSMLAKGADIVLPMRVGLEADRNNIQGTTSFAVLSMIFDALQTALDVETAFTKEQFALIHPGGAVGARLTSQSPT
ncbi:MAG: SIS domain-containing protein [Clostridiales bacterium]|jgi:D-arabinose 5-phosphate isomerase GutQ|nr:SIS domain-containing protein [Clostridiales bacterium]